MTDNYKLGIDADKMQIAFILPINGREVVFWFSADQAEFLGKQLFVQAKKLRELSNN